MPRFNIPKKSPICPPLLGKNLEAVLVQMEKMIYLQKQYVLCVNTIGPQHHFYNGDFLSGMPGRREFWINLNKQVSLVLEKVPNLGMCLFVMPMNILPSKLEEILLPLKFSKASLIQPKY